MPTPVIEALVPYGQSTTTSSTGSPTVTATNGSTTTVSMGGCGCCSQCPNGFLPKLFSTGGLCVGAIDNTVPVYLSVEMEFTAISPHTLAGYCLPSGKVFVGDAQCNPTPTEANGNGCNYFKMITLQPTCDGSTFEVAGGGTSNENFIFFVNSTTPEISVGGGTIPRVCGCNSGRTDHSGTSWANSLAILGKPFSISGFLNSNLEYVSHSCSPFSLVMKGTAVKLQNATAPSTAVAYVEITFTEATAPFLGTAPKINRLEIPCFNMSATPIDRANCNCPEKFVYGCKIHGKCRPNSDLGDGIKCCQGCNEFEEA